MRTSWNETAGTRTGSILPGRGLHIGPPVKPRRPGSAEVAAPGAAISPEIPEKNRPAGGDVVADLGPPAGCGTCAP